ncbi:hypothetical protein DRE_05210 [Drechslerella stenobrocha 248]|uniref:RING-type domain-containing protein n=1 Tax=Drechslerella stenobrocha 248 TaxID=1043628 RepID=W7HR37_9PEZI|nr:hypothetical protein DRE_05210 [Drechslerella stenobrocha 248]
MVSIFRQCELSVRRVLSAIDSSKVMSAVRFLAWLVIPRYALNPRKIPNIGFEQSFPDASRHFSRLSESPFSPTTLFSHQDGPVSIGRTPRLDHESRVKNAYKRYIYRVVLKSSSRSGLPLQACHVADGTLQLPLSGQTRQSPAVNVIYNCSLKIQKVPYRLKLMQHLHAEPRECVTEGDPHLPFPWIKEVEPPITQLQLVEYAFFGTNEPWDPMFFQESAINLSTSDKVRNRIAVLAESIGWNPCPDDQTPGSKGIMGFEQEATFTCFFCFDDKPLWQIAVLNCEHASCIDCVKRNFKMCLEDTSLLPPRCCQAYPFIYASIAAETTEELEKLASAESAGMTSLTSNVG